MKIGISTQIQATPTLTALKLGQLKASAAAVILGPCCFILKFLMALAISHGVPQNI